MTSASLEWPWPEDVSVFLGTVCERERQTFCVCFFGNVGLYVIQVDYLHGLDSGTLICNPVGPGAKGLDSISTNYSSTRGQRCIPANRSDHAQ